MDEPMTFSIQRSKAGTVNRVRLENFMCHSNLEIELGDCVNFVTGQNGSGKSAILTALCVAFGCRAKGTQRASTLKDFIKTGCSSALVSVELNNEGDDAFKPQLYGGAIIIERRISESTSSTVLKDRRGKRVASKKEELRELVEHFNIDVENPCVVMSQDKSREFLHSGNDRDKFKFFFKATLLQQVNDLLENIDQILKSANGTVCELEDSVKPIEKELNELQEKIDNMKHVERITQELQELKKKLAWSWVYKVDSDLEKQGASIEKLKDRIPVVQSRIDHKMGVVEELRQHFAEKKTRIASMMEKTSEVRKMQDELQQTLSLATKEKLELEEEYKRKVNVIRNMVKRVRLLEQQVQEIREQHVKNTQAEESQIEEKLKGLQIEVDTADSTFTRLKEEENLLSESINQGRVEIRKIAEEIENCEKQHREFSTHIRELQQNQTNKVTAFGGERVINLLREIERRHQRFKKPPIGPIGAHVTLVNGDKWAPAVEQALGKLLEAFIVTDHKDCLLLRSCAREANYSYVKIIIYDFSTPRLDIPRHMLPQTEHPTTLSVLHSENHTVLNVLVDVGNVERQVLVENYEVGKVVAFNNSRNSNVKEVYTLDGFKMFSRASVETILPSNKTFRARRLCSSFDEQIQNFEREALNVQETAQQYRRRKRDAEQQLQHLQDGVQNVKRRCQDAERDFIQKKLVLQDFRKSYVAEASASSASTFDELHLEISKIQEEIHEKEVLLEKFKIRMHEAEVKANDLRVSFENLCKSAKGDVDAYEEAERDLICNEEALHSAEAEKNHYEGVMSKELDEIKKAEAKYQELVNLREESSRKASIICPESEVEALGGCNGSTPEKLSAQVTTLDQRLKRERPRFSESIDDLMMFYEEKQCKILGKQQRNRNFREKLDVSTID
ncbi:Structural maintenance of chromosomes protein [Trema orientale]|uniref:Structural maintenance of chromosomes protein n=1 Tax=Trema orientale TaxID=63057 RepID=A0A2P5BWJ5_TREOI|nr:Structural maintenance of chromosomes protein [Trema orientale]